MPKKANHNLPGDQFQPKWDGEKFVFVERDVPLLTKKDHQLYDSLVDNLEAKASAEEAKARALDGATWVCDVPANARIFFRPGQIIVVQPGAAPVVHKLS
jgi:hypothetical protein